jgi:hypothetical protein
VPSWLVPPLRDRPGVSRLIRSVLCSMRFTGRPGPIPGGGSFHALMDRVIRSDVLWRAWAMVRSNNGAPGIDRTTLADVEEYGVARLLGELASELRERRYRPLPAGRQGYEHDGTMALRAMSPPVLLGTGKLAQCPGGRSEYVPDCTAPRGL